MKTIGIFEAKTHLSEIVQSGEELCITNRGKKIAYIVPVNKYKQQKHSNVFSKLAELKKIAPLGSFEDIQEMKKQGQK